MQNKKVITINEISERLKKLRKELKLTLKEFGANMGISTSSYNEIEKGRNGLTERNKKMLCQSLNVNPEWLDTGKGEMFIENDNNILEQIAKEYNLSDIGIRVIKSYLELPTDKRKVVDEFIDTIINSKEDTEFAATTTATAIIMPSASNESNK